MAIATLNSHCVFGATGFLNLLDCEFTVGTQNTVWCGDNTYIWKQFSMKLLGLKRDVRMAHRLSEELEQVLQAARKTRLPFTVTGFLIEPKVLGWVAVGRAYHHVRRGPNGRFAHGHLMHT